MPLASATVDTSVVIDAIEMTRPAAVALFRHGMRGRIDIAVSTRLEHELRSRASGELAEYLATLPALASPGRWGVSRWGQDFYAHPGYNPPTAQAMDADHVEAHRMSGRQYFVTSDERQAKRAVLAGVAAFTPQAVIAKIAADLRAGRKAGRAGP